ncbi:DUF2726 domain-containing protein [Sphingopyxis sp. USTB-05]|uniref:DUF2726 domain-containing protein n=1 Tax=Sphingopyxis sp. USTB-05 TaxID=2830667 RepID=UPI002078B473|nr:DUF2726 domain-containing protein [Sphingopyxis sp. USTB-05]USI78603.1 DUF2726 domain-containing protein [Sphingopyxis sp. USTB-05]
MLRLLNRHEEVVFDHISEVGNRYGLSVYPKVRVADVINLDAVGIDFSHKSFGLRAHFDFTISRGYDPLYAVEFDGPSHLTDVQRERDGKKDRLCQLSGLPILRVNSRHITQDFGELTLLAWIMETYEMQCGFYEAQERGQIPFDEPFDPFNLMTMQDGKFVHPLFLSESHRRQMRLLKESGRLQDFASSGIIADSIDGTMRGLEFIRVSPTHGLRVETAMRAQQFPILFSDLLGEILVIQLMERIAAYLAGEISAEPLVTIDQRIKHIQAKCRMRCSHSVSSLAREQAAT